jgi:hypothetical protein
VTGFLKREVWLLSVKTRNKYFKVQKENQSTLRTNQAKDMNKEKFLDAEYDSNQDFIQPVFAWAMTDDLMSRTRM